MIIELILGSYDAHSVQINKQLFISSTAHTHAKAGVNGGGGSRGVRGLLRGVAVDEALRQRLFEFINLSLGEVGVVSEIQPL